MADIFKELKDSLNPTVYDFVQSGLESKPDPTKISEAAKKLVDKEIAGLKGMTKEEAKLLATVLKSDDAAAAKNHGLNPAVVAYWGIAGMQIANSTPFTAHNVTDGTLLPVLEMPGATIVSKIPDQTRKDMSAALKKERLIAVISTGTESAYDSIRAGEIKRFSLFTDHFTAIAAAKAELIRLDPKLGEKFAKDAIENTKNAYLRTVYGAEERAAFVKDFNEGLTYATQEWAKQEGRPPATIPEYVPPMRSPAEPATPKSITGPDGRLIPTPMPGPGRSSVVPQTPPTAAGNAGPGLLLEPVDPRTGGSPAPKRVDDSKDGGGSPTAPKIGERGFQNSTQLPVEHVPDPHDPKRPAVTFRVSEMPGQKAPGK